MATGGTGYMRVHVNHKQSSYNWVEFTISTSTSSGSVWNNYGQKVTLYVDGKNVWSTTLYGDSSSLSTSKTVRVSNKGYPDQGKQMSYTAYGVTQSNDGDGSFYGKTSNVTGKTWKASEIKASNFSLTGTGSGTSRRLNYSSVKNYHDENVRYYQGGWKTAQGRSGSKGNISGHIYPTGLSVNHKQNLLVGLAHGSGTPQTKIRANVPVYPLYTPVTKGTFNATHNFVSITLSWGAWRNYGNITDKEHVLQVLNESNTVMETYNINLESAGSKVIDFPVGYFVKVRLMSLIGYHDGTTKREYSNTIDIGLTKNMMFKNMSQWKTVQELYYKHDDEWVSQGDLGNIKANGAWQLNK